MRSHHRWIVGAAALLASVAACLMAPAWADETPAPKKDDPKSEAEAATPPGAANKGGSIGGKSASPFPDLGAVVKDMIAQEGLLTLYRYNPNDPSTDQSRLLCRIPRALMNQDMLLSVSISRGAMAGYMWSDYLVQWQMVGRNVKLVIPNVKYIKKSSHPVTDAVSRTYTDQFLTALPIVTMAGNDPVIDLSGLLMNNVVGAPASGAIRRDLSKYNAVKVFPDNVLIDVDLATANRTGGGESVGVSYAFRRLPSLGSYKPRPADERVGYFTTEREDWNSDHSAREMTVRYINRWKLTKKEPSLELSPPEEPIVFYIEKTVPIQWRRWVKAGILEWNKAFEKIGFVDAIVVHQQTDTNEFKDIDPEDSRYNFVRWIVSGRAFAMGPSVADPRTGQLLDADIIFDDSMLRSYTRSFDIFGPAGAAANMGPDLVEFLKKHPEFLPPRQTAEDLKPLMRDDWTGYTTLPAGIAHGDHPAHSNSWAQCNYALGLQHQLAMLRLAGSIETASGKKLPENLLGEVIKEIMAHEVGHTLGLRHNFKASSWLTLEQIKEKRDNTDEPTSASVMDYNPTLFFPGDDPKKLRHVVTPVLGPYDYWAIEYGYSQIQGPEGPVLAKITSRCNEPGLAFATDEDTRGTSSPDPMSNRFDMSNDPIAWSDSRVALAESLLKDVKKLGSPKGEPNYYLRDVFNTLMYSKTRSAQYTSRLVGGQLFNRNRPGDPGYKPPLQPLDPAKQRAAIKSIGETLFTDAFFKMDGKLLNELVPSRWDYSTARVDFPIHDAILDMQAYAMLNLVSPTILQRVYDAELKSDAKDKFTTAELITSVRDTVWSELGAKDDAKFTNAEPMISSIRRNLQRLHLRYQVAIAGSQPGSMTSPDVHAMVRFALRELSEKIGATLKRFEGDNGSKIDFASRAHLIETKSQIDRVLEAAYQAQ